MAETIYGDGAIRREGCYGRSVENTRSERDHCARGGAHRRRSAVRHEKPKAPEAQDV